MGSRLLGNDPSTALRAGSAGRAGPSAGLRTGSAGREPVRASSSRAMWARSSLAASTLLRGLKPRTTPCMTCSRKLTTVLPWSVLSWTMPATRGSSASDGAASAEARYSRASWRARALLAQSASGDGFPSSRERRMVGRVRRRRMAWVHSTPVNWAMYSETSPGAMAWTCSAASILWHTSKPSSSSLPLATSR